MKATKKVFGAVALSAALALGTVAPAFADNTGNANTDSSTATSTATIDVLTNPNDAKTTIKVSTYTSQLKACLPLTIGVAADTAGGTGQSPTNYYIENNSRNSIYIAKVEAAIHSDSNGKWAIPAAADKATKLGTAAAPAAAPATSTAALGYIDVTLTPNATQDNTNTSSLTGATAFSLSDGTVDTTATTPGTLSKWTIPASANTDFATVGKGTKLKFTVDTLSSKLNREMTPAETTATMKLATVKYTIAAGVGL